MSESFETHQLTWGFCHGIREHHKTYKVKFNVKCVTSHPYCVSFPFYISASKFIGCFYIVLAYCSSHYLAICSTAIETQKYNTQQNYVELTVWPSALHDKSASYSPDYTTLIEVLDNQKMGITVSPPI